MTNIATLKARARATVERCQITPGEYMKHVAMNGQESFFMKEGLIEALADMMARHEVWYASQLQSARMVQPTLLAPPSHAPSESK